MEERKIEDKKKKDVEKRIINQTDYEYRDIEGNLKYIKTRIEFEDGSKTFKIEWKTDDKKLILYNLPSLKFNPDVIYFAEGEKCVLALVEAIPEHVDNVTVLGYSQSPEKEIENSKIDEYVKDKEIYIFVDNDEIGEKKAQKVLEKLKRHAKRIYVIRFSGREKGFDVADFLSEGKSLEDALLLADLEYEANYEDIDIFDLLITGVPPREYIDEDFKLPKGVLALIAGLGSVGKGYFLLYLSIKWVLRGINVCYITAEDDKNEVKRRVMSLTLKVVKEEKEQKGKFRIIELLDEDVMEIVERTVKENFDVIIIDPIGFLVEDENVNSQIGKVMRKLQAICKKNNVNIILSHHLKKFSLKDVKDKFDMLDAIRGAGSFHNNARYVWFVKRNKEDDLKVEVYNAKNSYGSNDNDFIFSGLFPSSGTLVIERLNNSEEKSKKGGKNEDEETIF